MSEIHSPLSHFLSRFILQPPHPSRLPGTTRQAAVLIGIVDAVVPTVVLTLRSMSLRHHPGQVAFPGGMREPGDLSPAMTALRETEEEIALPAHCINVIGTLPPVFSQSGVSVIPVVGIIPATVHWCANQQEVTDIFELPLSQALDIECYRSLWIERHHQPHQLWFSWFGKYCIWGMTAVILRSLCQQVTPQGSYPAPDGKHPGRERLS